LGVADIATLPNSSLAFRLYGLSDFLWGRTDSQPSAGNETEIIAVDGTSRIVVDPRVAPPQIHAFLGSVANVERAEDTSFTYQLDMRRAHTTFATRTLDDLLADWSSWMSQPPPAPLVQTLTTWWSQFGQIHLYNDLALLEVEDPVILRELEAVTSLTEHILSRPSPNIIVVKDSVVSTLLQEFMNRGYMPKEVR